LWIIDLLIQTGLAAACQTILHTNESGLATAKVSTEPTVYLVLLLGVHEVQICEQTQVLVTGTMVYVMYSVMSVVQIIAQPKLLSSNGGEVAQSVT